LNLNLHSNSELTYYIFLGVGVRQMTSPRVSELSLKKELPFIFPSLLSLPAREHAIIHTLLSLFFPLSRMIKTPPYIR
jgi:hypothetical protein